MIKRFRGLFTRRKQSPLYQLYPELLEREPLLRITSEGEQSAAGGYDRDAGYYLKQMWLHKAINVVANNLSPLPLQIVRGEDVLDNHPLYPLLTNPGPELSPAELWREWTVEMLIGGEVGLEAVYSGARKIVELWPRKAPDYSVIPASERYPRVAYYRITDNHGDPYELAPEQFVQFKFYNPLEPFRGISPVGAIRTSIQIDQLAQAWSRLFFKNQARPDYAVIAPEGITQREREEIEKQLMSKFSGGDGVHRPIVLEKGITDIKVFSFPPKDMEWLAQREFSRDEIAAIIGVPDEIMGFGKDTYENFATAEKVLWTLTILPLAGLRDDTLTRFFRRVKLLRPDEQIQTDTSEVEQLEEAESERWSREKEQITTGALTVNEWRMERGMEPVEWGDVWWASSSLRPVENAEEPEPVVSPVVSPEPMEEQMRAMGKAFYQAGVREYASLEHEYAWKASQRTINAYIAEMQRILKREFQRQQTQVDKNLRDSKEFGRGRWVGKENIPPVSSLLDYEDEVNAFQRALRPIMSNAFAKIGAAAIAEVLAGGLFDVTRPEVQTALRVLLEFVAKKVNDTTFADLTTLFQAAEAAGEGIVKIQERLAAYFGERKSDWQTERIARTTMTGAANSASVEAWQQSGVVKGTYWISALLPDRTRDDHAAAHGQEAPIGGLFTVGGEQLAYPGDPSGSPGNIINCLCALGAIVED